MEIRKHIMKPSAVICVGPLETEVTRIPVNKAIMKHWFCIYMTGNTITLETKRVLTYSENVEDRQEIKDGQTLLENFRDEYDFFVADFKKLL